MRFVKVLFVLLSSPFLVSSQTSFTSATIMWFFVFLRRVSWFLRHYLFLEWPVLIDVRLVTFLRELQVQLRRVIWSSGFYFVFELVNVYEIDRFAILWKADFEEVLIWLECHIAKHGRWLFPSIQGRPSPLLLFGPLKLLLNRGVAICDWAVLVSDRRL